MPKACVQPVDYLRFACGDTSTLSATFSSYYITHPKVSTRSPHSKHKITTILSTAFSLKINLLQGQFSTVYTGLITNTTY